MSHEILQDERYHVADEAICGALLLIMKEKPLDKITVADVIKRAGVVRSTFYNHYENIPDLILAIEEKTIHDIFSLLESFHPENNRDICTSFFSTLCEYTMTNPFLTELLRSPQGDAFFEKIMTMFHRYVTEVTKTFDITEPKKEEHSFAIAYAIGGTVGVLHKWAREDFRTPLEDVADILTETFMAGLLPLMS